MGAIYEFFERPIAFQRCLVPIAGSINAALMLSQAIYWSDRTTVEGKWFYKTQCEWEEETGLTRREQDGARKLLLARGLLSEDKRGVPATVYYRVQQENIEAACLGGAEDRARKRQKGMHQSAKLNALKRQTECTKAPNWMHQTAKLNALKRQTNTETTAETTAETTQETTTAAGASQLFPEDTAIVPSAFVVPPWIPADAWADYEEMRRRIRRPMTRKAKELAVGCLRSLSARGHPPRAVLEQSVLNAWQGLFEIKPTGGSHGKYQTKADRTLESLALSLARGDQDHAGEAGVREAGGGDRDGVERLRGGAGTTLLDGGPCDGLAIFRAATRGR